MLPEISLDDLRFQELVNEARTRILRHSPDWTEHNVSDPGITLIELFAWITEILTYRINRIPRRTHLALLSIIGVQPAAPQQARVDVRFILARPIGAMIPAGTAVASPRAAGGDLVVFQTDDELVIPVCAMVAFALEQAGQLHTLKVSAGTARSSDARPMFGSPPQPGDALLFGFEQALERLVVGLSFDCTPAPGERIDRDNPPLAWEVSGAGGDWLPADVVSDETEGFTAGGGSVRVEVPDGAGSMNVDGRELRWIRCRVTGERYGGAPELGAITAAVIGGTTGASHAETVNNEMLGTSDGIAGTTYPLQHSPVLALEEGETLEVREPSGTAWVPWQHVTDFRASARDDRHFTVDLITGEVRFGPAIRQPDGGWRSYGAVPSSGAALRFTRYRRGGGEAGNIAPRTLNMLPVPIEGVVSVTNPRPGRGGADPEPLASTRERARLEVQSRTRAVTVEDFEHFALAASSKVARAICVASGDSRPVRVHILPRVEPADRRLELSELTPTAELMESVAAALDRRRVLGTSIRLLPVRVKAISVAVDVRASPLADLGRVQYDVEHALYVYLNPLIGGSPEGPGPGWPSGRRLSQGELYGIVYSIPGVEFINTLLTFETDLETGSQAPGSTDGEISLANDELIASGEHTVKAIHRE